MVIGFWNIQRKFLTDYLTDFIKDNAVDILYLAEATDEVVFCFLKQNCSLGWKQLPDFNKKLKIFTRLTVHDFIHANFYYSSRWLIYRYKTLNIISVHLPSKVDWTSQSLSFECVNLANSILKVESVSGCLNTILIGDFNMDPFEDGIVAANALNAIQNLEYTKKKNTREVNGEYYRFFYNPMWNFFGDKNALGTHYYRNSGYISHEWRLFDQIMFRPSVSEYLDINEKYVEIITKIGTEDLTRSFKRPDAKKYSDHLPIILKLKNYDKRMGKI